MSIFRIILPVVCGALIVDGCLGQIDPIDRTILQGGVAIDPGAEADPGLAGFFYYNRIDDPAPGWNLNVFVAGPYLETTLINQDALWKGGSVGALIGGMGWLAAPPPEYVNGVPVRDEEFGGNSAWATVFFNQFFGSYTRYNIPLSLRFNGRIEYTDYFASSKTADDFVLPVDPVTTLGEVRLQFGGTPPDLRGAEALDVHFRYIVGSRNDWEPFGPAGEYHEAHRNFQKWIFVAGFSADLIPNHTTAFRLTAAGGRDLDRTTAYRVGGFLTRSDESIRIAGYITQEFIADEYLLANLSHQLPLADWRKLALHLKADWAEIRRKDERVRETRTVRGLGAGLSVEGPWESQVQVLYGCGLDADREGGGPGHSVALILHKEF